MDSLMVERNHQDIVLSTGQLGHTEVVGAVPSLPVQCPHRQCVFGVFLELRLRVRIGFLFLK